MVTSLAFATLPAPDVTAFRPVAGRRRRRARRRVAGVGARRSRGLAASLLVTAAGDAGEPPAVTVFGAMLGSAMETATQLGALADLAGAEPDSAELAPGGYREAKRFLSGLGAEEEAPGHPFSRSEFFRRPLPAEAIGALVERLPQGRRPGEARELDFSPWGGAYNRVVPEATAFVHRRERFLLKHAVTIDPGTPAAAPRGWLDRSWATVHPWGSGGVYPNFPDPELADPARAHFGANLERLLRVKAAYDPDDHFGFPRSLGRAAA